MRASRPASTGSPVVAEELTRDEIERYLVPYRPEHMHILRAAYRDGTLWATFRPYCPEIYRRPPRHLTRVVITHFVGQAAHVLLGCLARAGQLGPIGEGEFLACVNEERATFRRLVLEFRRFVPSTEPIELVMWCVAIRQLKGYTHLKLHFELGERNCVGEADAILLPPRADAPRSPTTELDFWRPES